MNKMKKITLFLFIIFISGCVELEPEKWCENSSFPPLKAKNIIFMVPDGMGLANVTAARIFKNGPNSERLSFEKLPRIGYQSTHSANTLVTDSAAGAAAWACGEKFNNGEISCHSQNGMCINSPQTILELAESMGKTTGLVATSSITHATPAAWAAHVHSRECEAEIGRQFIEETGVDVLLGGDIGENNQSPLYNCGQYSDQEIDSVIALAIDSGYRFVTNKTELNEAVENNSNKVLGLFAQGRRKTPETYRVTGSEYPPNEPKLSEMTQAALSILEKDPDGFFLMVEGSQIDWGNHENRIYCQLGETLGFEEAVQVVVNWLNKNILRKWNTLLIVVADHETGSFVITGNYSGFPGNNRIVPDGWATTGHTAVDTIIRSSGPGSACLGRALDNTDIFYVMENVLD